MPLAAHPLRGRPASFETQTPTSLASNLATPVVFRYKGFRFCFYSDEGNPREPLHVHVRSGGNEAKFWLEPQVRVATSYGFDAATLRERAAVAQTNTELITKAWHEYFC